MFQFLLLEEIGPLTKSHQRGFLWKKMEEGAESPNQTLYGGESKLEVSIRFIWIIPWRPRNPMEDG